MRSYRFTMMAACVLWFASASADETSLAACKIPDFDGPARCGVVEVPENRDRPGGRTLKIHVAVVPASSGRSLPDPIVTLMGGPGEEAILVGGLFAKQLAPLLKERDLLLVDQRGTGKSNGLKCDLHSNLDPAIVLRDVFPLDKVGECAKRSSERADLTQYTYAHFAADLEHVRRALGYGPLNLSAGSYGTRAAQVFIRNYPDSVRTVLFHSAVPIDIPTPSMFAKSTDATLNRVFQACAEDPACHAAFANPRKELAEVLSRLDAGVRVSVPGSAQPVLLNRGRVAERLRSMAYRRDGSGALPWMIHQAHAGNWQPIVDGLLSDIGARSFDSDFSFGFFFNMTCNEDIPFIDEQEVADSLGRTYLGDYRVRQQQAACALWPKVALPPGYREPVRSAVPALFVSGDYDAALQLWTTEHVARGFSKRFQFVMRGYGHTEWNECAARLYERFVVDGSVAGLDKISCGAPLPLKFKT